VVYIGSLDPTIVASIFWIIGWLASVVIYGNLEFSRWSSKFIFCIANGFEPTILVGPEKRKLKGESIAGIFLRISLI
jgi:hypothetical protein